MENTENKEVAKPTTSEAEKPKNIIKPFGDEVILGYEAKFGGRRNLKLIELPDDEDNLFVYLVKRPSRSVIQAIGSNKNNDNPDGVAKLLFGCILEGDMDALENDGSLYLSMVETLTKLIRSTKGEIKKL